MCLLSASVYPVSEVSRFWPIYLQAVSCRRRGEKEASYLCAQAVICVLRSASVMWFTLPLLCTENIAERNPILWSLVMPPLTFTSDYVTDTLVKELVVVTQHFLRSLYAEDCCCYWQECILRNRREERTAVFSSPCCGCCYLADYYEQLSNREWRPALVCLFSICLPPMLL